MVIVNAIKMKILAILMVILGLFKILSILNLTNDDIILLENIINPIDIIKPFMYLLVVDGILEIICGIVIVYL